MITSHEYHEEADLHRIRTLRGSFTASSEEDARRAAQLAERRASQRALIARQLEQKRAVRLRKCLAEWADWRRLR